MPYARDMDAQLHRERTGDHRVPWSGLPDGVFVASDSGPAVVVGHRVVVWIRDDNAYRDKLVRPSAGDATVFTPPSTVEILRAGYAVQIDESALY